MSGWTPEQDAKLYQLFVVERLDATSIAGILGRPSRSSILGRAHRKGWKRKDMDPPPRRLWTDADRLVLIGYLDAGFSRRDISKKLKCTEQSIKHLIDRWNLQRKLNDFWTTARVAQIKDLYAKGLSYTEIGDIMGCARGTISGKAYRLGLIKSEAPRRHRSGPPRAKANPALHVHRDPTPIKAETEIGPVKIMDLGFQHCRWPLAMHGGEQTFCGRHRAHEGTSYCAEHREASFAPFKPNQAKTGNQLARQLRRYAA